MKHKCGDCKHWTYEGISKSAHSPIGWCDRYKFVMQLASDRACEQWEPP